MKAIILAGGKGTRLYPLSLVTSKHLIALHDKPMIYYPLTTLIASGIKSFCIVTSIEHENSYKKLLGNGVQWGIKIQYRTQPYPGGIAHALICCKDYINSSNFLLMLGDNFFSGGTDISQAINSFKKGACIFAYHVKNPSQYGVINFNSKGHPTKIEEKPSKPNSSYVVTGLYIYDKYAIKLANKLKPSKRGELEITDLNNLYLQKKQLAIKKLPRGFVWLDAGSSSNLLKACNYVSGIEARQGIKIGCPEEAAFRKGLIKKNQLVKLISSMPAGEYKNYLNSTLLSKD